MGIIRLEDKYKSKYKVQFTPERHYISSSSGITGSVHVFPNRSETQKDNIDERLNLAPMAEEGNEFSGAVIRPYDSNSLEARRLEIYKGSLGKFIGGAFTDAIIYEYRLEVGDSDTHNLGGKTYTGETINDEIANDARWDFYDDSNTNWVYDNGNAQPTATRTSDGTVFTYQSNDVWVDSSYVIHNKLPENDRDRAGQNFEIALGMLLDGANPFTGGIDDSHAWRSIPQSGQNPSGYTNAGNSSYTNASNPTQRGAYQFTGFKIFEDEFGIPYQGAPITRKEDVNAWPPEIEKWSANVIGNWVVKGYSDLSMHPRNATKKEVLLRKANHDLFSSGSMYQRTLANRISELNATSEGWWVNNDQALCLGSYQTPGGSTKQVGLGYYNQSDRYTIDWSSDSVTFEFWIKPCKEQVTPGTIVSLRNNYGVCLIPDTASFKDGIPQKFKIGVYAQGKVVHGTPPTNSDAYVAAAGGGIYVTGSQLNLNEWHHVVIRYGSLFNNGLLNVYLDSVSMTSINIDGKYDGASRTTGIFDVTAATNAGTTMLVGAWPSTNNEERGWGVYSSYQEVRPMTGNNPTYTFTDAQGKGVQLQAMLKSELKELRIWSVPRPEQSLLATKNTSLTSTTDLKAYIPFFFDPRSDTPQWNRLAFIPNENNPQNATEFYANGTTETISSTNVSYNPVQYCVNSGHIVGMPFINVHSHLREYVNGSYPLIYGFDKLDNAANTTLYPSIEDDTPTSAGLNYFIDHWKSFKWLRAINSMILPSDCTVFTNKYDLMSTSAHTFMYEGFLRLNGSGVGSTTSKYELLNFFDDEIFAIQDTIVAIDPSRSTFGGKTEQYGTEALVSEGKLVDNDFLSPLSTVISVPQIYYGNRISPDSIELKFTLNEEGKQITIVDYEGTLYRKDLGIDHIKSKVGHVDYGNGLLCIFSPLLTSLGIDNFDLKLKGEKNMHVMQLDIPCPAGVANKSQHPSYKNLRPSANANENDSNLTYISSIYLHDENLNIIGKVNLAQPVQKREEDSFIFRVKVDF